MTSNTAVSIKDFGAKFSHTYFNSQTIVKDDVMKLQDGVWLNDSILNFYYLYLECEKYKDKKDDVLFVCPSTSYWIQTADLEQDDWENLSSLEFASKKVIFITVNDCEGDTGGGSHWSLMVYHRNVDAFYYYDSHGTYNLPSAQKLAEKFYPNIAPQSGKKKPTITARTTPQQQNGYDCGCHVLVNTDSLAAHNGDDSALSSEVTAQKANALRKNILQLLMQFKQ